MSAEEPPKRRRGVQIQCFTLHQCKIQLSEYFYGFLNSGPMVSALKNRLKPWNTDIIQQICTNYKLVCYIMIHFWAKLLILDQVTFYYLPPVHFNIWDNTVLGTPAGFLSPTRVLSPSQLSGDEEWAEYPKGRSLGSTDYYDLSLT